MMQKNKGWKGIGRALVLATNGSQQILHELHGEHVVAIQLAGTPAKLMRRRSLAPELLDVMVLDATRKDRNEVVELSRALRARYLASVLVVPRDIWGKRVFRSYLSVFSHEGAAKSQELWTAISVAAQLTWSLAWLRLDKQPRRIIEERSRKSNINMQSALLGKCGIQETRPSRTEPWAPPGALLAELTKAYTNDEL